MSGSRLRHDRWVPRRDGKVYEQAEPKAPPWRSAKPASEVRKVEVTPEVERAALEALERSR